MPNGKPMQIDVQPGATPGDYFDQLLVYLVESGPRFADMTAKTWVGRASGHAMHADEAAKVSELALAAYAHRP